VTAFTQKNEQKDAKIAKEEEAWGRFACNEDRAGLLSTARLKTFVPKEVPPC